MYLDLMNTVHTFLSYITTFISSLIIACPHHIKIQIKHLTREKIKNTVSQIFKSKILVVFTA